MAHRSTSCKNLRSNSCSTREIKVTFFLFLSQLTHWSKAEKIKLTGWDHALYTNVAQLDTTTDGTKRRHLLPAIPPLLTSFTCLVYKLRHSFWPANASPSQMTLFNRQDLRERSTPDVTARRRNRNF